MAVSPHEGRLLGTRAPPSLVLPGSVLPEASMGHPRRAIGWSLHHRRPAGGLGVRRRCRCATARACEIHVFNCSRRSRAPAPFSHTIPPAHRHLRCRFATLIGSSPRQPRSGSRGPQGPSLRKPLQREPAVNEIAAQQSLGAVGLSEEAASPLGCNSAAAKYWASGRPDRGTPLRLWVA